ncbi:hypothetical protein ACFCXH_16760, partial [Streptomyces nojiriensis]
MDLLKADYVDKLGPLLSAEAAAEAPGTGVDAADLEQAVWVRLLESGRHAPDPAEPAEPARWLRRAVRAEARSGEGGGGGGRKGGPPLSPRPRQAGCSVTVEVITAKGPP